MTQLSHIDFERPATPFPLLPLRRGVLLPGTTMTLSVGRRRSLALFEALQSSDNPVIGVAVQRDPRVENPSLADLLPVGTFGRITHVARVGRGALAVVLEGLGRFQLRSVTRDEPFWLAEGALSLDQAGDELEARLLAEALRNRVQELDPEAEGQLAQAVAATAEDADPGLLADRIAGALSLANEQEVMVLLTSDVTERLRLVIKLAGEVAAIDDVRRRIDEEVRRELNRGRREHVLRQQLKAIQRELGEDDDEPDDDLRARLEEADLPDEVRQVADRELKRLSAMGPQQAESHVIRTYLEWLVELPWSRRAEVQGDIAQIEAKLEEDHYGLDEPKKRILEHMAVLQRATSRRGTLLCLVGPPGVGKTSLAQSVAEATGRPLVRIALGGVRDEASIRGHRRTYVGALPGRIVAGLRKAGVCNPVMVLDEIDKLGASWAGNPEAALLEVLDPEQNARFTDHYLEVPVDLSEVLFICTANELSGVSPPLLDRLEIVPVTGYTTHEKTEIAKRHLLPGLLEEHGLTDEQLSIGDSAIERIVRDYTREAGVRQLKRELVRLCRATALAISRGQDGPITVTGAGDLKAYLGKARFDDSVAERTRLPGVATGLAWTPVGGDVLFVETSRMPGKGRLEITGKLGDVMRESAQAALTYVRSHAGELGIEPGFLESSDLHIHVPAGAVPKDGPSAGVTMFTALASLLTGRRVRADTAMTGEVTLRGRVLPVGGIKSKVLAAHRAGLSRVVLPRRNDRDLDEVPELVRDAMSFIFADDMSQVLAAALDAPEAAPAEEPEPSREVALAHA